MGRIFSCVPNSIFTFLSSVLVSCKFFTKNLLSKQALNQGRGDRLGREGKGKASARCVVKANCKASCSHPLLQLAHHLLADPFGWPPRPSVLVSAPAGRNERWSPSIVTPCNYYPTAQRLKPHMSSWSAARGLWLIYDLREKTTCRPFLALFRLQIFLILATVALSFVCDN
jgi:hypothetical protein